LLVCVPILVVPFVNLTIWPPPLPLSFHVAFLIFIHLYILRHLPTYSCHARVASHPWSLLRKQWADGEKYKGG
jgi:hypothetical protein